MLFLIFQGVGAVNSYIETAVCLQESDVNIANVVYARPTMLQVLWRRLI